VSAYAHHNHPREVRPEETITELLRERDEARADAERLREALEEIRTREWVENALDPQWAAERAEVALDQEGEK
jgi:hypothetical protein